jgi:hypothetical protein
MLVWQCGDGDAAIGVSARERGQGQKRWIPAYAGMTATTTATALDSGLRRIDSNNNGNSAGFRPAPE